MEKIKKKVSFVLRLALALGIIGWLVWANHASLAAAFNDVNYYWLAVATALYVVHLLVGALRWEALVKLQKMELPFGESLSLLMQGFFFSLVVPGGALGGDVVKAGILASRTPRGSKLESMFSVLVDRIVGMVGMFSMVLIAAAMYWRRIMELDAVFQIISLAIVGVAFTGLAAAGVLFFFEALRKIRLVAWVVDRADTFSHGSVGRLLAALGHYRGATPALAFWSVFTIVGIHLNMILIMYCIALGLGAGGASFHQLVLATLFGLTASLLPLTPAGVGTRDVVIRDILVSGGYAAGAATAIPLIYTSLILVFSLIGGLFFIFDSGAKSKLAMLREME